ncbi:MAG TPA: fructosamine kinase family protein [Woeseiaceae bacterium]|nr:fructosamine kinase family protein [Woeseiaceae bacterium]
MSDWHDLKQALRKQGIAIADAKPRAVGGGDIGSAWKVPTDREPVFLKTGPREFLEIFSAEAEGLEELGSANAVRVPAVLAFGLAGSDAYIALEWLDLGGRDTAAAILLGRQLALQHRNLDERFGWHRDNMIGTTPQLNDRDDDWIRFFRERRLLVQLQLAESNGFGGELLQEGARLARNLDLLFDGYAPVPSLLHGDLWGGNWSSVAGEPVIFDPAVYYGDRESDLAMTRLFGGFGSGFYRAYEDEWPLARGHEKRVALYQLYHVLNHLNMFGVAYLSRAMSLIRELQR